MYRSFMAKPEEIERKWYVVDAEGKTLGRLASQVAAILRGKHKPTFTPHVDCGDHVIIINAEKVVLTGNKLKNKIYYRHTMYPGGLRAVPYGKFLETQPEKAVERAIKGMIPHTRLGKRIGMKLKVYKGPEHPHAAQMPEPLDIKA
ncbi:MAG TPA: 50S ribosomal protein L13 [Bacillota bacterium]|nr:50S ribosomal protein L13 [Bacillota bacterium]HOH10896.1 50S ribosomal protein L13 [Bacillota bacterium]HOS50813.1 50S ribosomal protein L13 [Bacillota bacterium]HOY89556.1 50S ribosomal protein L13 [Bacillota bacterium]HPI01454.1 50S ribosomal protein L13 [Bacillota bacterium]